MRPAVAWVILTDLGLKILGKGDRIQGGKHAAKGIMRWNPVRQRQEGLQPCCLGVSKAFNRTPAIYPRDHRTNGYRHQIDQALCVLTVKIRPVSDNKTPSRLKLLYKNGFLMPCCPSSRRVTPSASLQLICKDLVIR